MAILAIWVAIIIPMIMAILAIIEIAILAKLAIFIPMLIGIVPGIATVAILAIAKLVRLAILMAIFCVKLAIFGAKLVGLAILSARSVATSIEIVKLLILIERLLVFRFHENNEIFTKKKKVAFTKYLSNFHNFHT